MFWAAQHFPCTNSGITVPKNDGKFNGKNLSYLHQIQNEMHEFQGKNKSNLRRKNKATVNPKMVVSTMLIQLSL